MSNKHLFFEDYEVNINTIGAWLKNQVGLNCRFKQHYEAVMHCTFPYIIELTINAVLISDTDKST